MKNYLTYLKENPAKLFAPVFAMLVGILANVFVNNSFTSVWLSIFVGVFTTLVTCLLLLQVWGEYKGIEGFKDTIKEFFRW